MICKDGTDWKPTDKEVAVWKLAHPGADLNLQFDKMAAWLQDNPTRRKTPRGMPRFVNAWLARVKDHNEALSQDKAPLYADLHAQAKTVGDCYRCDGKRGWEQGYPKSKWVKCPLCG